MTKETKQTAVDWLVKEYHLSPDSPLVQQAKEMEKQQIINATIYGDVGSYGLDSEQYYNKTYGGNNG